MKDEFYIGYLKEMPKGHRRRVRLAVAFSLGLAVLLGAALVLSQRGFSDGVYELGTLSRVQGVLSLEPVPCIRIWDESATATTGPPVRQSLMLMSFGKFGADEDLAAMAERIRAETGKALDEVVVTLEGTLDYRNGQTFFELSNKAASLMAVEDRLSPATLEQLRPRPERYGEVRLSGEIVDSKCYFGTMKPGNGKPHRSCAIRCVAGGIPPVLVARNEAGATAAYLLRGPQGEAINQEVLPYIADPTRVQGELLRYDDWYVLRLDPATIERVE